MTELASKLSFNFQSFRRDDKALSIFLFAEHCQKAPESVWRKLEVGQGAGTEVGELMIPSDEFIQWARDIGMGIAVEQSFDDGCAIMIDHKKHAAHIKLTWGLTNDCFAAHD